MVYTISRDSKVDANNAKASSNGLQRTRESLASCPYVFVRAADADLMLRRTLREALPYVLLS
jgi:hypothetical protein